jgi:haloacid dehalogenase-like hydrolase
VVLVCLAFLLVVPGFLRAQTDPLPSWNDGPAKQSIVAFVQTVIDRGRPQFVPLEQRIATFDNDGTLWPEQPIYFQFAFALARVKALAPKHPEWKTTQPFKAVLDGDMKALAASGEKGMVQLLLATHTGMTTDEFTKTVTEWIATAQHPRFNRAYTDLVFQPMLELLAYLRANGFKTYIVSGGTVEFMRPWTERVYGIPPEQVVGTSFVTTYKLGVDASPCCFASRRSISSTTAPASPSTSRSSSGVGPCSPSATPTATFRCSSGRPPARARGSWG